MQSKLSSAEAEVYDRQIRLWGADVQTRIKSSHFLVSGMNGLGAEVCKNWALAGISLTLNDTAIVKEEDLGAQFLLKECHIGKNRAEASLPGVQELNPFTKVDSNTKKLSEMSNEFLSQYSLIVLINHYGQEEIEFANRCRELSIKVISMKMTAQYGQCMFDLGSEFIVTSKEGIQTKLTYPSIEDAYNGDWTGFHKRKTPRQIFMFQVLDHFVNENKRNADCFIEGDSEKVLDMAKILMHERNMTEGFMKEEFMNEFVRCLGCEINFICATLGGIFAQQVLEVVSAQVIPIRNCLTFDGDSCVAMEIQRPLSHKFEC